MSKQNIQTFFYYSKNFPKVLQRLKCTLFYSTYQAGKVIMISSQNGETITKYAKNFKRPMGIAISDDGEQLAIASRSEVSLFSSDKTLSYTFPDAPKKYSHLYIPQSKFYTGIVDTHEIGWHQGELLITNTIFSCISSMSHQHHFDLHWKPDFITELAPEDRCHLNGVAFVNDRAKYVTMFAISDEEKGWRKKGYDSGVLMDVDTGTVLIDNLAMPHSPVFHENKIYFLQSALGHVMCYDIASGNTEKLAEYNTFIRGMEVVDDLLFIGLSKIRPGSSFFSDLPLKAEDSFSGIRVLDRKTGKEIAGLTYTHVIDEIFSVRVKKGIQSPALLTENDESFNKGIDTPQSKNYWLKTGSNK